MTVKVIFAIGPNGEFGIGTGILPWRRIPKDMRYFQEYTRNRRVIMGRHTWNSLPTQKLPGRYCAVVSRGRGKTHWEDSLPDVVARTLQAALPKNQPGRVIDSVIIGGVALILEAIAYADEVSITHVPQEMMLTADSGWDIVANEDTVYMPMEELQKQLDEARLTDMHFINKGSFSITVIRKGI
jgi:dihydrofolate reductase